ncbi:Metalloenzyme, LuxS/M16 peptidase-like protein [Trametes elegans]|nr:Metalloenzyme, LuxS/M16 peptidase-like protein [Trametes elegans]
MSPLANGSTLNAKPLESHGNFDLVKKFKLDFADIHVSKWKSRSSGLSVVHLDYDAPLVNGYFVVATEIFDDSGCPHTLEHLVFMGSEKYPYKGIIDHLANRGFSNGTNAWTDQDHTAYTVSTAGEQGFLQLLPVYVDHILYPTLTKAGYITEVHHIDGKGENSGVVYSEMQGRENTSGDLMALRMQRLLNPPGSAYRSETGGLMEALRVLTVEQIRDYHRTYYVPHNLSLIVTGKLASGTKSLLDVVQNEVEPRIVEHGQNKGPKPEGWKRPFVETASAQRKPIAQTIKETVEFPEKDESVGELQIGFLGPPPTAFLERKALDILGTYLTSSPVAPLNKEFVEIENPLCTYIYFAEDTRATYVDLPIYVGSVPTEHLDTFDEKLKASLRRVADEGFDMDRMAMVINRDERQLRSKVESSQGDTFSGNVITDHLYGAEDGTDLAPSMDDIKLYAELKTWTSKQWADLLRKYYVEPPSIVVRGRPSGEMADRLDKAEKARIAAQKEKLGPEGLAECERILEQAKQEHEKPIPNEILTSFPVPSVKSISWIPVQSYQEPVKGKSRAPVPPPQGNAELAKHIEQDGTALPFFVQYDHVKSDFVTIHAYFSLATLPERLRPYISAYLSAFFSLPVTRSTAEKLNHEEVVHRLDSDTVSYEVSLGVNNAYMETMRVSIKVETAQYENAVAWLRDLVYGSEFDKDRLQVTIAKIQQSLPEMKRDGDTVLGSISAELLYDERSTARMGSVIPQIEFVPKLAQQLQDAPADVLRDFEEIRTHLTDPTGVRISVNGDILALKEPRSVWARHFGQALPSSELAPLRLAADTLSAVGRNPVRKAVVVSLPTIESAFVTHTAKGVQGWAHPEYPALRVATEVLNATESFLWRYIRGSGLAYGASCGIDLEAGLVNFTLYRGSNSTEAFKQAASVIKGLADGSIALDDTVLDAAKSSIVFGVAKSVSTPGRAAITSFINQGLKGVSQNFNIELLEKFQQITKEDVLGVLRRYFLPLFDASSSVAVVVIAPSKAEQVSKDLAEIGFDVEQRTLQVEADEDGEYSDSEEGSASGSESESDR